MLHFQFMQPPYSILTHTPPKPNKFLDHDFVYLQHLVSNHQSILSSYITAHLHYSNFHEHTLCELTTFKKTLKAFNTILNNIKETNNQLNYITALTQTIIQLTNNQLTIYSPDTTLREMIIHECEKEGQELRIIHIQPTKNFNPIY